MLDDLKQELPVTESQAAMEIDFITKPKDLQKALYQEKMLKIEETKGEKTAGISSQSKRISKKPAA